MMLFSMTLLALIWMFLFAVLIVFIRHKFRRRKNFLKQKYGNKILVGLFHPYCNAGGGGERVLWTAIRAIQKRYRGKVMCVIYTGDQSDKASILNKVQERFNIVFEEDVHFVFLKTRVMVDAKMYPFFTLILQSFGSIILGFEALFKFVPDIYIDTMGYAFTLPVFKFFASCSTGCYVHYPTISTDMLSAVSAQRVVVHNRGFIARRPWLSSLKITYYKAFSFLYGFNGRTADVVMVNSSWTKGHITSIWKCPSKIFLVYPPCDVTEFANIPLLVRNKCHRILSIAQFRPEKDHSLQIKAFHKLLEILKDKGDNVGMDLKLVLVGSCRDEEDEMLVDELKKLCNRLKITESVEFKINLKFPELVSEMANASLALHTMWNEHFGIGVVECMSAGLIMIAHDSGGPKMDIVIEYEGGKTGFLASDVNEYAESMLVALRLNSKEQTELRENARRSAERFSVENFEKSFLDATEMLFL